MKNIAAVAAFQPSIGLNQIGLCHKRSLQGQNLSQKHHSVYLPSRARSLGIPVQTPRERPFIVCTVQEWHTLTANKFDEQMANNSLAICFVGMSNCGKSHWSRKLQSERDFQMVCVDDEIERAIKPELTALGYSGIDGMAEWMGFPSDERFAVNQACYLNHEERITAAAKPLNGANCVLDTTGSVIYLTPSTISSIQSKYLVVHLEATDDMLEFMTKNYFENPKPVVWGDAYKPIKGESADESLRRCYPDLLRERRKRYAAISHLTVPASLSLSREINLDGLFSLLKGQLC